MNQTSIIYAGAASVNAPQIIETIDFSEALENSILSIDIELYSSNGMNTSENCSFVRYVSFYKKTSSGLAFVGRKQVRRDVNTAGGASSLDFIVGVSYFENINANQIEIEIDGSLAFQSKIIWQITSNYTL